MAEGALDVGQEPRPFALRFLFLKWPDQAAGGTFVIDANLTPARPPPVRLPGRVLWRLRSRRHRFRWSPWEYECCRAGWPDNSAFIQSHLTPQGKTNQGISEPRALRVEGNFCTKNRSSGAIRAPALHPGPSGP